MPNPFHDPTSDVLDFCCGSKKCPALRREQDAVVISDPDQATGEIRLTREQVQAAMPWLADWLDKA